MNRFCQKFKLLKFKLPKHLFILRAKINPQADNEDHVLHRINSAPIIERRHYSQFPISPSTTHKIVTSLVCTLTHTHISLVFFRVLSVTHIFPDPGDHHTTHKTEFQTVLNQPRSDSEYWFTDRRRQRERGCHVTRHR